MPKVLAFTESSHKLTAPVTGGLAILAIATDITEAIYVNVHEAESN